jgi:hypothetical protein
MRWMPLRVHLIMIRFDFYWFCWASLFSQKGCFGSMILANEAPMTRVYNPCQTTAPITRVYNPCQTTAPMTRVYNPCRTTAPMARVYNPCRTTAPMTRVCNPC